MCTTQKLNLARVQKWFEANNCKVTEDANKADKVLVISILIWLVFVYSNQVLTIISILIVIREIIITSFRYYLILNNADTELIKANKYGKLKTAFQFFSIFLFILSPLYSDFYLTFSLMLLLVSTLISYFSLTIYFLNWIKK